MRKQKQTTIVLSPKHACDGLVYGLVIACLESLNADDNGDWRTVLHAKRKIRAALKRMDSAKAVEV